MTALPQQLDIFEDSPDVMLRNDVLDALLQHDGAAAQIACRQLASGCPSDGDLPAMTLLATALEQQNDVPVADQKGLARERCHLEDAIVTAAARLFSAGDAAQFMRPWWRRLARRGDGLRFDSSCPDDHAAPLWLRGESWAEAAQAVERIESWRRIPAPLSWRTEAGCRLGALDESWPLLVELAWLSPRRLDAVVRRVADPLLSKLLKKFGASFDGNGYIDDLAWFPAWVLTETPALAKTFALAWPSQDSPAERGMRLLIELLGLERQGRHRELIERRRALRDSSPPLYAAYMATRQ